MCHEGYAIGTLVKWRCADNCNPAEGIPRAASPRSFGEVRAVDHASLPVRWLFGPEDIEIFTFWVQGCRERPGKDSYVMG